jgi:KDO2-lipid IV(A) lauroyltransferase
VGRSKVGRILSGHTISADQRAAMRAAKLRMFERARNKGVGKRLSYAVQASLLFPLVILLRLMPVDVASAFGGWFGRNLVYRLIDRKAHYETMRVAFPDRSEAQLDEMLAAMSDNVGRVLGETLHLRDFAGAANPRLRITGADRVRLVAGDRPVLFVGGHFGNWELIPVALRAAGFDGISVVQHPNNPHVLEWIATERYRAGLSTQVGAGEGVYAALRRRLKAGGVAAMLADQRVLNGIRANFFGIETMTNLIPARLARELGAAVVLMSNRRLGGARFEIELQDPIILTAGQDRPAEERAFMEFVNRFFEAQIMAAPSSWLWGHPRFDDALYDLDAQGKRIGVKGGPTRELERKLLHGDETSGGAD